MTLCNCAIIPEQILNFNRTTHLAMNATIGHTYLMQHAFKPNTLGEMESEKCRKYQSLHQWQRLAFAPMVTNSFLGLRTIWTRPSTNLMEPCWPLCTNNSDSSFLWMKIPLSLQHPLPSKQQIISNFEAKLQPNLQKYFDMHLEGITTCICGINFSLTCSPQYTLQHN